MLKPWAIGLIKLVVLTICVLTSALAVDCHIRTVSGNEISKCDSSDDRALATLSGMLATLLALRTPTEEEDERKKLLEDKVLGVERDDDPT